MVRDQVAAVIKTDGGVFTTFSGVASVDLVLLSRGSSVLLCCDTLVVSCTEAALRS